MFSSCMVCQIRLLDHVKGGMSQLRYQAIFKMYFLGYWSGNRESETNADYVYRGLISLTGFFSL